MKPTPDDILTVLDLMAARVPDRHVTPDPSMVVAWLDDLSRFDRSAVLRAAREWGGLRFPSAHEFVKACEEAARAIALEEVAARQQQSHELPLSGCPEHCDDGVLWSTGERFGFPYEFTKPCSWCRPVQHAVWQHRASHPDVDPSRCPACVSIKRGKDPLPDWFTDARELQVRRGRPVDAF